MMMGLALCLMKSLDAFYSLAVHLTHLLVKPTRCQASTVAENAGLGSCCLRLIPALFTAL